MSPRIKFSVKYDISHSEAISHKRSKKLRIESDEDGDEGYEPSQERRTSYNESYTRGGEGSSSSPSPAATSSTNKRRTQRVMGSEHEKDEEDESRLTEFDGQEGKECTRSAGGGSYQDDDEEEAYDRDDGGRGTKRRRTSFSSPLSTVTYRQSSPPRTELSRHAGPSNNYGKVRKPSSKAEYMTTSTERATTTASWPTKETKPNQRRKYSVTNPTKRKRRQVEEESEEEEECSDDELVDIEEEEEEAKLSETYESEDGRPARGRKGRTGGWASKALGKGKEQDAAQKAKFEGSLNTKKTRTSKQAKQDVNVVDESMTLEPSNIGSPAPDSVKEDAATNSHALLPKKRKLPTIKKIKNAAGSTAGSGPGTGPSTPGPGFVTNSKAPVHQPPLSGGVTGSKLALTDKQARQKTTGTSDLDLSNRDLYNELFKNPGGNASRAGLNRAKEEERRKDLDKMRDEYKSSIVDQSKTFFDLQGQAEKMARFDELLRQRNSSAVYPNFLAAKWREEWEREKRRAHRQEHQHQSQRPDSAKEEGEM